MRTAAIDLAVRRALSDSVARVLDKAIDHGLVGHGADWAAWHDGLLATRRAPPKLWVCYHELVLSILRADVDALPARAADLLACRPDRTGQFGTVLTISDADLSPADAARYRTVIDNDPSRPLGLLPVAASEVDRIRHLVHEGRVLLSDADPVLLDEIDTLGHQIVLATNAQRSFGGAATVFLWGAVILNPDRVPDRVTLVESLAHETAHALLFGLTLGADLTTNDPGERYGSPLRPDLRPIEGIVHATYVLARMNYAMARLREHPELSSAEQATVTAKIVHNATSYEAGLKTVLANARFTPDGEAIFAACREAMALSL